MKVVYVKMVVLAALISLACTTRVSEWMLINALPDQYTLVCFHNGTLTETLKKQNQDVVAGIRTANIQFKTATRQDAKTPYYGLFYRNRLFSQYNNPAEIRDLTSSPLRENVAAELVAGKLCVMVYLKTDNKDKDQRGLETLRKAVESSPFSSIIPVL